VRRTSEPRRGAPPYQPIPDSTRWGSQMWRVCATATAWRVACVAAAVAAALGARAKSLPFLNELCDDCADCVSGMQTSRRDGRILGETCV
jgi:anti-sigma-K factor RskA